MSKKSTIKPTPFFGNEPCGIINPACFDWKESEGSFVRAVNMRRDKINPRLWRPTGIPATIRTDSWKPLQRLTLPGIGKDVIFMLTGSLLGFTVPTDGSDSSQLAGDVTEIALISGTPLHFSIVEAGTVRVLMRHAPAIYLTYSVDASSAPSFTCHGAMPQLPDMSLTVGLETTLSEPVTAMKLSGYGAMRNTLNPADLATATSHLLSAYSRLHETALGSGYFIQPTLARYRLLDAAGDTIAVSPTVLLSPSGGFQCCGEISLSSADNLQTLSSGALTAKAYSARLVGGSKLPAPWSRIVRNVVIETAGEIDPIDSSKQALSTVTTVTSSSVTVKFHMPGVAAAEESQATRMRARIVKALAASESNFRATAMFPTPFLSAGTIMNAALGAETALDFNSAPAYGSPLRDNVCHGICSRSGNLLFKADTLTLPFQGHSPAALATARAAAGNATWQGVATVTITAGDGTTQRAVATCDGGDSFNPSGEITALSPLLTYPDLSATQITVTLSCTDTSGNTSVVTETYPLTPLPQAGIAYYLHESLAPMMPGATATKLIVPESTVTANRKPGELTVCNAAESDTPISTIICSDLAVTAAMEAPRSRSSWDFARTRLIVCGLFGSMVITLGNDFTLRSSAVIDTRPVTSAQAVSLLSTPDGATILAIAGGDLVALGSGNVKTLLRNCGAESVGFCTANAEILLSAAASPLRRLGFATTESGEISEISIPGTEASALMQFGNHTYIAANNGLFDVETEVFPQTGAHSILTLRHSLPRHNATSALQMHMIHAMARVFATGIHGTLIFSGDNGSRHPLPLVTMQLGTRTTTTFAAENRIDSPLFVPAIIPRDEWIETTLNAFLSSDAEWHPIEFALAN